MEAGARPRGGLSRRAWLPAAGWCAVFAAVHVYWAVGGGFGLASAAGAELAATRPLPFVLLGLYGVVVVLVAGAVLAALLGSARLPGRWRTFAGGLCLVVGVVLLLRGGGLELVLLADLGGVASAVGAEETFWSLVLWNPWFVLGGLAFLLLAAPSGRRSRRLGWAP